MNIPTSENTRTSSLRAHQSREKKKSFNFAAWELSSVLPSLWAIFFFCVCIYFNFNFCKSCEYLEKLVLPCRTTAVLRYMGKRETGNEKLYHGLFILFSLTECNAFAKSSPFSPTRTYWIVMNKNAIDLLLTTMDEMSNIESHKKMLFQTVFKCKYVWNWEREAKKWQ